LGVGVGGGGRREGREKRVLAGSRAPPLSLDAKLKTTRRIFLPRSPRLQRGRGGADLLPSPWSACKRRKREREKRIGKARVHLAEFKLKFEFLQTRFENLSK
jgi:hypothetical protein